MLCKWCKLRAAKKTFCSHPCRNAWTSHNNKTNNPIHNPASLEKMRLSLSGKKLPEVVKNKMSVTRKRLIKENPDMIKPMLDGAEQKYLSKIRGKGWKLVRLKALERDKNTCQHCGITSKRLVVHHLDWRGKRRNVPSAEWNNDLDNLITLCDKCHNSIHRHKSKDYRDRYNRIIATNETP